MIRLANKWSRKIGYCVENHQRQSLFHKLQAGFVLVRDSKQSLRKGLDRSAVGAAKFKNLR